MVEEDLESQLIHAAAESSNQTAYNVCVTAAVKETICPLYIFPFSWQKPFLYSGLSSNKNKS